MHTCTFVLSDKYGTCPIVALKCKLKLSKIASKTCIHIHVAASLDSYVEPKRSLRVNLRAVHSSMTRAMPKVCVFGRCSRLSLMQVPPRHVILLRSCWRTLLWCRHCQGQGTYSVMCARTVQGALGLHSLYIKCISSAPSRINRIHCVRLIVRHYVIMSLRVSPCR